ncbi:MAG: class II aldolase/adducin family protein [bacterium]|nr:class II aldolase/adducin family protein [bacterium]
MSDEYELREAICRVGRRMWEKGMVAATDGNISVRLGPDRFLCTPSGMSKTDMTPADMVVADSQANRLKGDRKVTSEFYTHLAAYEERDDIGAVVHAHPPKATALTLAGISMVESLLPEVVYTVGAIPTTDYATPGTREGASVVREWIRKCDAVLLDRHGALTVGADLDDAYLKMEKVEHAAEVVLTARMLGDVRALDGAEIEKLKELHDTYGVTGRVFWPEG